MRRLGFNRVEIILASIAIAMLTACSKAPVDPVAGIAITNVTVIDALNGVRNSQTVLFNGDEIVSVSDAADAKTAETMIDGTGKYLIPGLWDMHVHLTFDDAFVEAMPELFLAYGVTSVRDTGGLMHKLLPVVEKMRAPGALAPRVFFSGPLLDGSYVVYDGESSPEIGIRNSTPEVAAQNVAQLKSQGVDFIKIYELVSPDVFYALVNAAGEHNLPIAAHVPLSMDTTEAGPLVGTMEHLRNIEMACAQDADALLATRQEMLGNADNLSGSDLRWSMHRAQRQPSIDAVDNERCQQVLSALTSTIQVPTARLNGLSLITPHERPDWSDATARLPESVSEEWLTMPYWIEADPTKRDTRFAEWSLEMIGAMNAAGVPIGAGTDTPIAIAIPGYSLHNELDMLVRAGLTPMQALRSATVTPAEFLGIEDKMGTIDVGKRADLILLTANPLDDIRHSRKIDLVVSKGVIVPQK